MTDGVLAIVPARGGSKRLPGKNLQTISGKTLLELTAAAAKGSRLLDRIVVSTDSPEIRSHAWECDLEAPFLRPEELSRDETLTREVLQHAVDHLRVMEGYSPQLVVTLQVTSPLRTKEHIDGTIEMLLERRWADSAMTYTQIPARLSFQKLLRVHDSGEVTQFEHDSGYGSIAESLQRYGAIKTGPSVLVTRTSVLETSLYGDRVVGYEIPWGQAIDIDTLEDLREARALAAYLFQGQSHP